MEIVKQLAEELGISSKQVQVTITLMDEGNTVPFIARYRKEMTGGLDDEVLRTMEERLLYLRGLAKKKDDVRRLLTEMGLEDEALMQQIQNCQTLVEVEDLYRPYRPKRKTRASEAKRKGLEALADLMLSTLVGDKERLVALFVRPEMEVMDLQEAISGAKDILAERFTEDPDIRKRARKIFMEKGLVKAQGRLNNEERTAYEMYYDYAESLSHIAAHRYLALTRGEKEGILQVDFSFPDLEVMDIILTKNVQQKVLFLREIKESVLDGYKRLLLPSLERDIRHELKEKAEEKAIRVFAANVKKLLLQPPIKGLNVLGFDPAFRTGCKLACVDASGKLLETAVIYPTEPHKRTEESQIALQRMVNTHHIRAISLGNGTACRESEQFLMQTIEQKHLDTQYTITNEAGASVYSASKLAQKEFPALDVTLRSAISIARRLIDPLAELVKIEPKAIGVGQYQHDVDQKLLGTALDAVVEDCVNLVGVNLNTASVALLSRVSGLSPKLAQQIVDYREEKGLFAARHELLSIKGIGPKAYEQAAGFLRIPEGINPLDNTGVHPEAYAPTENFLTMNQLSVGDAEALRKIDVEEQAKLLGLGIPTLRDIVQELLKPGRDPREDLPLPLFKSTVVDIKDLKIGMVLRGVVRNVVDFGAFVDIGVHQDGLVHISELSDQFVRNALENIGVGDQVDVRVIGIEEERERVSLSMKGLNRK